MEVRLLRYFIAVAREGSLTKAARYLHVTQPTLSRQMKELEDELGTTLFIRRSHHLELTEDGDRLRERAREILMLVDKTESEFLYEREEVSGYVYIGAAESDLLRFVAAVAMEVREHHPQIKYHLYSGNEEEVSRQLDSGLLDFGMLMEPADLSKYHHITVPDQDVWGLMMRRDAPLAALESVSVEDIKGIPLFVSRQATRSEYSQNIFSSWLGEDISSLHVVGTFDLVTNASVFIKQGMGYAFTVEGLMGLNETDELVFRPLRPALRPKSDIVWKQDRTFSSAAQVFFDEMMRQLSPSA